MHASAILATHIFGTPCDVEGLQEVADRNGLRLFFDAAHAFGSTHGGTKVGGFGDAEVFSLSPTKVVVAAEGGIIATNDDLLAERCRIGRNYGNPGDYDCRFVGLNARMSELHAATALASLQDLDERLEERNRLAASYTASPRRHPRHRDPGGRRGRPEHVQGLHGPRRAGGLRYGRRGSGSALAGGRGGDPSLLLATGARDARVPRDPAPARTRCRSRNGPLNGRSRCLCGWG